MAGKGRIAYYSTEETLSAVLEGLSDKSELEASESSDAESDHLSEPSNVKNARNQVDIPFEHQNELRRGRGRGRGIGRNRGQARGRGQPIQEAGGEENIAQDVLIVKNGTVWQTTPQVEVDVAFKT